MITRIYNGKSYYTKIRIPSLYYKRYLIKWQPNHKTCIHSHVGKCCYFYLLKGKLKEHEYIHKDNIIVKGEENIFSNFLDNGYINDKIGKHSLKNLEDNYSYSYHVYK